MHLAISMEEAVDMIPDGARVMLSGFMGVGTPDGLVRALAASGKKDLTVLVNDAARPHTGVGPLVTAGCVRKFIGSHIGVNPVVQEKMRSGELEVELVPQGTFVERIRAGGMGLGGILTPTGIGTLIAEGKDVIEIDGKQFLLEKPLRADFALIAARSCDYVGNLTYMLSATNFNPIMALSADVVIAEPEEIVPVGVIPPDAVKTPGILVDHVIKRTV
ncbi:acetyl-CoA:acetoacetyl-CoA transferase subunit alpha [Salipiger aestuarii]|uniref:Acetate CoA/acetoacetate CoA-transferase alpha subunit n=1 Tax=Salipiger aestuarii TaxID=568098 RepID=A0A327Y1E2_9RHOB|nr:3-oxoacid CoA-transferase subunit A [Salipiger aestuarii]EIE49823.1 3-oxoacid CoA-transferase, A subunit [Citreicella sp. 357]KAA8607007.1 acetyl-CoA:acetoacetyl-CoA transferase subunit alpha [Salipiger aestuarii]KAA8610728.1 acetyl-CoA:acetoacetyl-CoA transferase subunit alpha [Salipiger aestuarii]KAB2541534.1 acetyl-CoA:acetoacetyl-CoA transferase subunit alpha [Salipiger aestuarii]RAK14142.1 acetate CoA/acetoacetate CoA-transferase alpha subunit [Salipiger aestuarii]